MYGGKLKRVNYAGTLANTWRFFFARVSSGGLLFSCVDVGRSQAKYSTETRQPTQRPAQPGMFSKTVKQSIKQKYKVYSL